MSKEIIITKHQELSVKLNESVLSVLGAENVLGFEKSYQIANAITFLKENLTDEYMKPIMAMQGSRLGFKTDKDKDGGYSMKIVKECLIDATLTGVQPYGNQFNIIAGNMYVTKEGYGYLLSKVKGLKYVITPALPRISIEKGSAAVEMNIKWTLNGEKREEKVDFAIKVNNFMGTDAVIGKATRKARAWLFNQVSDIEVSDGDVDDVEVTIIETKPLATQDVKPEDKELIRFKEHLDSILSIDELNSLEKEPDLTDEEKSLIEDKRKQLKSKK